MRFDLAELAKRARNPRRKWIVLRDIVPPGTLVTDLYLSAYRPVTQLWSRWAEQIIAEYERSLSALTTDAPIDIQNLIDQADGEFQRILIEIAAALEQWGLRVEAWQRGKWRGAILSATGVDLATLLGPADVRETIEQYLAWNTALVKDVSAQAQKRMSDAVFSGLTQRLPAREVAASIRDAVDMSRKRSIAIASDQLSKMTSELARERTRQAGLDVFAWHHSRKAHPRANHKARDGHLYSENADRVGATVDGKVVEQAPPKGDRAGEPPYCGCRERGVLVFD